jgi:hypothetical protein
VTVKAGVGSYGNGSHRLIGFHVKKNGFGWLFVLACMATEGRHDRNPEISCNLGCHATMRATATAPYRVPAGGLSRREAARSEAEKPSRVLRKSDERRSPDPAPDPIEELARIVGESPADDRRPQSTARRPR